MRISHFVVIILTSAFLSLAGSAQQPVREKAPAAYPTRDSLSKKSIEEQYAAEINKYRSKMSTLNKEINELDKKIKDLELAGAQAEKDYQIWLVNYEKSPGRKDPQAIMLKQFELKKKLDDIVKQINQCEINKKIKKEEIKAIQWHIAELEKEKEALLKKAS